MYDRTSVTNHQARAGRDLEVVQQLRIRGFLLFAMTMTKKLHRLDLRQIQRERATRFVFYLFGTFGIAANLLQLYNTAFLGAFWPFFTGIVVQLVTAMFQFARMILLSQQ